MARRTRIAALLTLAMINVFTLAAGVVVVRMLPPRLAALRVPSVAAGQVSGAGKVLATGAKRGSLPANATMVAPRPPATRSAPRRAGSRTTASGRSRSSMLRKWRP